MTDRIICWECGVDVADTPENWTTLRMHYCAAGDCDAYVDRNFHPHLPAALSTPAEGEV